MHKPLPRVSRIHVQLSLIFLHAMAGSTAAQCQIQQLLAWNPVGTEVLGDSVVLAHPFAFVGATGEVDAQGTVRVLRVNKGALTTQQALFAGPTECQNRFGSAIDAGESILVVGDHDAGQANCGIGIVYLYELNGQTSLVRTLTPSDAAGGDCFGKSVSVAADVVTIGAPQTDALPSLDGGAVYVVRPAEGEWIEETKLTPPESSDDGGFGWSIAAAPDVVIVGDHTDEGPNVLTGAAFVYRYKNNQWVLEQELKPSDALPNGGQDWFGWAVALDAAGDTAVIGAKEDMAQLGSAYVFEYVDGVWTETQKLLAMPSFGSPAYFGYDVDISDDGNIIIVGAQSDSESGPESGAAHIFRRVGDQWVETYKFIRPGSNCLGASVALHGDYALVGDPCENGFSGAVYLLAGIQGLDCNNNGIADACDIAAGTSFDGDGDGVPNECDGTPDFDGDGNVGPGDLAPLLAAWGDCALAACPADLNMDGMVGPFDLAQLLAMWGQVVIPPACPKSAETCCDTHASPGCGDDSCCDAICGLDAFCCEVAWDTICVNESQAICGCPGPKTCGETGAGDCCAFNGLDGPGCNDPQCCETICDYVDPFCCDVQWDASCVMWALQFCGPCPPPECTPDAGECCVVETGPPTQGCNDPECCTLICNEIDPFCCMVAWDQICVGEALDYCEICGGTPPGE